MTIDSKLDSSEYKCKLSEHLTELLKKTSKSYKVFTNYYLSLCNPYKQRAFFNTTVEWE